MKKSHAALLGGLLILAAACSTLRVRYDYYAKADFAKYHTFQFLKAPGNLNVNEILYNRIKDAVTDGLVTKGFKAAAGNADLVIAIHSDRREKVDVMNWGYSYFPFGWYWRPWMYWGGPWGIDITSYDVGKIVLDFVDAGEKKLVWRAVATEDLPDNESPETIGRFVRDAVDKMLQHFPPR